MTTTDKSADGDPKRTGLNAKFWVSVLALIVVLFGVYTCFHSFHYVGMKWAGREINAYYSGRPRGMIASRLSLSTLESWGRYHRDALVRQGVLVHRDYRFEQIPCPSPEAEYVEQTFLKYDAGRPESAFSSSGRASDGDVYAVSLWCHPNAVPQWDTWYKTHNNKEFVAELLTSQNP